MLRSAFMLASAAMVAATPVAAAPTSQRQAAVIPARAQPAVSGEEHDLRRGRPGLFLILVGAIVAIVTIVVISDKGGKSP